LLRRVSFPAMFHSIQDIRSSYTKNLFEGWFRTLPQTSLAKLQSLNACNVVYVAAIDNWQPGEIIRCLLYLLEFVRLAPLVNLQIKHCNLYINFKLQWLRKFCYAYKLTAYEEFIPSIICKDPNNTIVTMVWMWHTPWENIITYLLRKNISQFQLIPFSMVMQEVAPKLVASSIVISWIAYASNLSM